MILALVDGPKVEGCKACGKEKFLVGLIPKAMTIVEAEHGCTVVSLACSRTRQKRQGAMAAHTRKRVDRRLAAIKTCTTAVDMWEDDGRHVSMSPGGGPPLVHVLFTCHSPCPFPEIEIPCSFAGSLQLPCFEAHHMDSPHPLLQADSFIVLPSDYIPRWGVGGLDDTVGSPSARVGGPSRVWLPFRFQFVCFSLKAK